MINTVLGAHTGCCGSRERIPNCGGGDRELVIREGFPEDMTSRLRLRLEAQIGAIQHPVNLQDSAVLRSFLVISFAPVISVIISVLITSNLSLVRHL